MLIDGLYTYFQ